MVDLRMTAGLKTDGASLKPPNKVSSLGNKTRINTCIRNQLVRYDGVSSASDPSTRHLYSNLVAPAHPLDFAGQYPLT